MRANIAVGLLQPVQVLGMDVVPELAPGRVDERLAQQTFGGRAGVQNDAFSVLQDDEIGGMLGKRSEALLALAHLTLELALLRDAVVDGQGARDGAMTIAQRAGRGLDHLWLDSVRPPELILEVPDSFATEGPGAGRLVRLEDPATSWLPPYDDRVRLSNRDGWIGNHGAGTQHRGIAEDATSVCVKND